jgi:hypothetical protein
MKNPTATPCRPSLLLTFRKIEMATDSTKLIPLPEFINAAELHALYLNGFVAAFLKQDAVLDLVKREADFLVSDAELEDAGNKMLKRSIAGG